MGGPYSRCSGAFILLAALSYFNSKHVIPLVYWLCVEMSWYGGLGELHGSNFYL